MENAVYPIVPGHEIVGVVSAVGSNVTKFKVGDKVGVGCFVDSCVGCATRDLDNEHYLPGLVQTYNSVDADGKTPTQGGYSDQIVVRKTMSSPYRTICRLTRQLLFFVQE